ncbi:MAG: DUF167 family protein [Alphaproteobacteria bacterium]|nr:DUF167 family protein [Alphaproteobacteria bacterium]
MTSKTNILQIIKQTNNDVLLFVKIVPNSQENSVVEILEYNNKYYLKVKIKEVAKEFKANKELLSYLSKIFNTSKNQLSLEQGESMPFKTIKIKNNSINIIQEKILQYLCPNERSKHE